MVLSLALEIVSVAGFVARKSLGILMSVVLLCSLQACGDSDSDSGSDDGKLISYGLVAADIDRDGRADIVTANTEFTGAPNPGSIKVILQDGVTDGEFEDGVFYEMGADTFDIAVGYLDDDTLYDVIVSSRSEGLVYYRLQKSSGVGNFGEEQALSAPGRPGGISIADLNNDAVPGGEGLLYEDLVVGGSSVAIWLNPYGKIPGGGDEFIFSNLLNPGSQAIAVADLNNDGYGDIVTGVSSTQIGVYLQIPSDRFQIVRTFEAPLVYTVGAGPVDIAIDDLLGVAGEGLDIAVVSRDTVSVLRMKGINTGEYDEADQYSISGNGTQLVIADLDNEKGLEIAVTNNLGSGGGISIFARNPEPGRDFVLDEYVRAISPWGLDAADFDRDGFIDLAYSNVDGAWLVLQNPFEPGEFNRPHKLVGGNNNPVD